MQKKIFAEGIKCSEELLEQNTEKHGVQSLVRFRAVFLQVFMLNSRGKNSQRILVRTVRDEPGMSSLWKDGTWEMQ